MPVRLHVLPLVFVSAAVDDPPMAVRLTLTVDRLLLASVTVQERVVVVVPSAGTLLGVNVQAETTGGTLGAVTVMAAVFVPVPLEASVAVIVGLYVPGVVPTAAVTPVRRHVVPLTRVSAALAAPPMDVRSTVTEEILLFASVTVH